MANELMTLDGMERLARSVVASNMFGYKSVEEVMTVMATAVAEGRHPASVVQDYHYIKGRMAKKAEAMQRDLMAAGGRIEWHELTDERADATFSHPAGGRARITWDLDRAKRAGLLGKDNWNKYPRAMLRSRCVSEGVRTVCPMATSGFYTPEEVRDMAADEPEVKDVTPRDEAETQEQPNEISVEQHNELCASIENATDLAELKRAYDTAQSFAKRAGDGTKRLMYASLKDERKDFLLLRADDAAPPAEVTP